MAVIEHSTNIRAPFSQVLERVTQMELEALQEWQPTLTAVNVTAGNPLRAGSIVSMRKKLMGNLFLNGDVVDFQRNKRIELKGIMGRYRFNRVIELMSAGLETTINDTIQLQTPWFYFWHAPFFSRALRQQTAEEWQLLKQLLDR